MKAILTFNLSDPDERQAHMRAVCADDAFCALSVILEELRNQIKYQNHEFLEPIQNKVYQILGDQGIQMEKLWT